MSSFFESVIKGALEKAESAAPELKKSASEFFGAVADKWLRRGSSAVSKIGPHAEGIVNGLNSYEAKSRQMFGEYSAQREKLFNAVEKKSPDVLHKYEDYFTKKKPITDPALQQLINFDKVANLSAYGRAQKANIPVGPLNPDDWSRIWPKDSFDGSGRDFAVNHLMKTGQASNEKEAERLLDFLVGRSKGVKDHNLMSARKVDLPGYRTDVMAQLDSMQHKIKSVAFAETFGPKGEMLDELLSQIRRGGKYTDYKTADKYVDVFLKKTGSNYQPRSKIEQGISSVLAARYLGRTVIKHFEKPVNIILFQGRTAPVLKGMRDMIVDFGNANEFAIRSGAAMSQTLNEVRTQFDAEFGRGGSWVTKLTGLNSFDRLSRVLAANSGKHLASDLLEELQSTGADSARSKLLQLGIDSPPAKGGLSESQLLTAAQRTSDVTQFVYNPSSLPMAWQDSPYSRLLTRFKPFPYIMGHFLKDHVLSPALKGDLKPLMYFSLLFPTVGEVVADLSNLATFGDLKHRPDSRYIVDRIVDNVSYMAGFGMLFDLTHAMSSPSDTAAWKFVAGPLLSSAVDLFRLPKSQHPDEELMRQIPIVGPLLVSKTSHRPHRPPNKHSLEGGVLTHSLEKILGN